MWSSVAASGFGDRVIMLAALTLMGANQRGVDGTSLQAGINFFFFIPYLVLGVPAGWLADRMPRKWIMLSCDESRAAMLLLSFLLVPAAGAAAIDPAHHWKVLAVVAGVGVFAAIFNPARNATIPQIVPMSQLQSGNALIFGIAVIASMIGLGVGGKMFDPNEAASVRTGLGVGFLFFAVSGTFFAFLKLRSRGAATSADRPVSKRTNGMHYVFSHRTVLVLILLNTLVWGAAMIVANAAVGLCKLQYGFSPDVVIKRYTIMAMMIGLGMLCGAGWVAWMNTRRESAVIALGGLFMAGVCTAFLAMSRSYEVALMLAFGVGFFGNTTIICIATLLQTISPNFIRGRVMGTNTLVSTVTTVAVNFVIWRLPNADTIIISVLQVASLFMAATAILGLWRQTSRGPLKIRSLNVMWHFARGYLLVWHRLRWRGRHFVPPSGPVILAINHTTGLDPFLVQMAVHRTVTWLMDVSYCFGVLNFFWSAIDPITIDRRDSGTGPVRQVIRRLKAGQIVGIFPEGGAQRDNRELKPFQAGIALIAARSEAVIVPVWVEGTPLKLNMFWHFTWPSRSTVTFGRPYRPETARSHEQVVEDLRQRMLALAGDGRGK